MDEILEIGAAEFKAKCLQLLDEIGERKRDAIIITKRGKPVARLGPVADAGGPIYGALKSLVTSVGLRLESESYIDRVYRLPGVRVAALTPGIAVRSSYLPRRPR